MNMSPCASYNDNFLNQRDFINVKYICFLGMARDVTIYEDISTRHITRFLENSVY